MVIFENVQYSRAWYTKDFGDTWTQFASVIGASAQSTWSAGQNPDTFFSRVYLIPNQGPSFAYTNDYGSTWNVLINNSIGLYQSEHYVYVGVAAGNGAQLYSSSVYHDTTHTDPSQYLLCEFPFGETLPELAYVFLSDSTNSEFIAVFNDASAPHAGIFSSEFNGRYFTYALPYVYRKQSVLDFHEVPSLPGVLLANQWAGVSTQRKTLISFDNGGEWRPLNPGQACAGIQNCSLHLHGMTSFAFSSVAPFYSVPSAAGVIIGVGNVGLSVSDNTTEMNTWVTENGGLFWRKLWSEPCIYDVGDYGSLIVFAPNMRPTDTIYYSTDSGNTIKSFIFNSEPVMVDNIITDPSGISRKFVILYNDLFTYGISGLDFSDEFNVTCVYPQDYMTWQPSDDEHGNATCFMGASTSYLRRKWWANCFANISESIITQTPCPCDWEDYECDVGFFPTQRNSTDGFSCSGGQGRPACATGFRLVPGTLCSLPDGLDLTSKNCSDYSTASTATSNTITTSTSYTSITAASSTTATTSTAATTTAATTAATTTAATTTATTTTATTGISTATTATGNPSTSTSTGGFVPTTSTTGGKHHKGGAGVAVGLTFLFLVLGAIAIGGFMYWRNLRFRNWINVKIGRESDPAYQPINRSL